jgi:hypothetical protein
LPGGRVMWGTFGVHKPDFLAAHVSRPSVLLSPAIFSSSQHHS